MTALGHRSWSILADSTGAPRWDMSPSYDTFLKIFCSKNGYFAKYFNPWKPSKIGKAKCIEYSKAAKVKGSEDSIKFSKGKDSSGNIAGGTGGGGGGGDKGSKEDVKADVLESGI